MPLIEEEDDVAYGVRFVRDIGGYYRISNPAIYHEEMKSVASRVTKNIERDNLIGVLIDFHSLGLNPIIWQDTPYTSQLKSSIILDEEDIEGDVIPRWLLPSLINHQLVIRATENAGCERVEGEAYSAIADSMARVPSLVHVVIEALFFYLDHVEEDHVCYKKAYGFLESLIEVME